MLNKGSFSDSEGVMLRKAMPEHCGLWFDRATGQYVFTYKEPDWRMGKTLLRVKRTTAQKYQRPVYVFNFIARRELYRQNIRNEMRLKTKD